MQFKKQHVLLIVGCILVSVVTGSQVNASLRHPDYAGLQAIAYLLRFLPSILITNTAVYGLPFLAALFLLQQQYKYSGIISVLLVLNWTPYVIHHATSYLSLSQIGVQGIGLMWLSYLGIGLITLLLHFQRFQLPPVMTYLFTGIMLATAVIVSINEILYWTTSSFGYL